MGKKLIIESLAMDLKRVALGLHKGSTIMANRFKKEALKRSDELEKQGTNEYLSILLQRTRDILKTSTDRTAEDALMYSILFQNFAIKNFS